MTTPPQPGEVESPAAALVLQELLRRGLRYGVDFDLQLPGMKGRLSDGGSQASFLFHNPPGLAISTVGLLEQVGGDVGRRLLEREQLAGKGVSLVFLDEEAVLRDAQWVVGEALQYRDHSRLARGLT